MSKAFWGLVMFFSLVVTVWAGFFVYNELQPKEPVPVPLRPLHPEPGTAPQEPMVSTNTTGETRLTDSSIKEESDTSSFSKKEKMLGKKLKPTPSGPQDVTLIFSHSSVKKVFVAGEFNKWFRQALKQEGTTWKITLKLDPGSYKYVFIVDEGLKSGNYGRRMTDPGNNNTTEDGKFSILTVPADSDEN